MRRPALVLLATSACAATLTAPGRSAEVAPLPPERPAAVASPPPAAPADPPLPPARPNAIPAAPAAERAAPAAEAAPDPDCPGRLDRLGLRYEPKPDITENDCSVRQAVLVSHLPDGLEMSPPSMMTCAVAEALAHWTIDVVSAEADRHLNSAPIRILIGTSYQCRSQRSGAKLSEHAFGNGVDVMGFVFAKRPPVTIGFLPEGSPEANFQEAVRKGACPSFSTVLGPGSDADHGNHLHLDQRGRNAGYRICQ